MNNRRWTKEEEEFLFKNWGVLKVETIAKRLDRAESAVTSKAYRLRLGTQMSWYGSFEVSEILGISRRNVLRFMEEGKIKTVRDRTKKKRYIATDEHIRRFMRDYQDLWDSRRVTINLFDNKPKWLIEKELKDKEKSIKKHTRWSDTEVKILLDRYRRSWTLSDIAKELSRSEFAVKNKLAKIDYGRKIN